MSKELSIANGRETGLGSSTIGRLVLFGAFAASACGGSDLASGAASDERGGSGEAVAAAESALTAPTIITLLDDSAAPLHVEVKACVTTTAASSQTVDCTVDFNYALVGGGAKTVDTAAGAMLTASIGVPASANTWRASSHDEFTADPHNLISYAVGVRLDGVNTQVLRNSVFGAWTLSVDSSGIGSSGILRMLSGGFSDDSGLPRFLVRTLPSAGPEWGGAALAHLIPPPAHAGVTVWISNVQPGIIEGFGALDVVEKTGAVGTVTTGIATALSNIDAGYAVLGYGANSTATSGPGRLLTQLGPNGTNLRQAIAQSMDHAQASAGSVTLYWTEARKLPGTHGLCSAGTKLSTGLDTCSDKVCAADPFCCSTSWDGICVSETTSICGKSCANDTCSLSSYNPAFWSASGVQTTNDSYNYATNRRTDSNAQPGRASGQFCSGAACFTPAIISSYAVNDGLMPIGANVACPDNRERVALAIWPNVDARWYRQDANTLWSFKAGSLAPSNVDAAGQLITNPQTAARGNYTAFAGYFCACSSSLEGAGHSVIN